MASFDVADVEKFQRLDWQILLNGAISLYYSQAVFQAACEWFKQHQYHIYSFDCTDWNNTEDFHTAVSAAFHFPDYYGRNLDALNDCLADIDVPLEGGTLLTFFRFNSFATKYPSFSQNVLDIIQNHSRQCSLTGQRLVALIQSDDTHLTFEPVGVCPVLVNPVEWFSRSV